MSSTVSVVHSLRFEGSTHANSEVCLRRVLAAYLCIFHCVFYSLTLISCHCRVVFHIMRRRFPSPKPIRPHICSLRALAAVAARPQLDPDLHRDPATKSACVRIRGKLSEKLLDWCDDLYGTLSMGTELARHIHPDTVWIPPAEIRSGFSWGRREIGGCDGPENIAVFCSVMDHIDWGYFDAELRHRDNVIQWIAYNLKRYATAVFHDFIQCRELFMTMLTRLYRHPAILDRHTLLITEVLVSVGLPVHIREHIRLLDQRYDAHLETILDMSRAPMDTLSLAVKTGQLGYIEHVTDEHLLLESWSSLIVDACLTCEAPIFDYLWDLRSKLTDIEAEVYHHCASAALSVSNSRVLSILFHDCDESMTGFASATWADRLLPGSHDDECTNILLHYGCDMHTSLFFNPNPQQLRYLLSRGASVIPPSLDDAGFVLCAAPDLACSLINRWRELDLPAFSYLCEAIRECGDHDILRQLVRVLDRTFELDNAGIQERNDCLSYVYLHHHMYHGVLFYKTCLRLGVDIDVQDHVTGRSLLMDAARSGRDEIVRFFVSAGSSVTLRDNDGKSALDHYDACNRLNMEVRDMLNPAMH